jgi:CDGSH-type Zn-finger protein
MADATITPCKDGPYLIRGDFQVLDQDGNEIPLSRKVIALCRCGRSRTRPFCDGTHKLTGFRSASAPDAGRPPATVATSNGR